MGPETVNVTTTNHRKQCADEYVENQYASANQRKP